MNVLIVGLGSIAKKHIEALLFLEPDAKLYALRSICPSSSFDGVHNIYSLDELAGIRLDFILISNPTSEHKKAIETFSRWNCPLFIEKPLYHLLDIGPLVHKIENSGLLTYVACNLRFLDCLSFVRKELALRRKRINEINVYCGSYLPEWRKGCDFRTVYSSIPSLGGGVHLDLIHELDYLYWFFGMPQNVRSILKCQSGLEIQSYDYANYCMEYEGFCASVILNYYRRDTKRTLEIVFDDETWNIDLIRNQVSVGGEILFVSAQTIRDTYLAQMNYFLRLLRDGEAQSSNTIADAFNVLKICLKNDVER